MCNHRSIPAASVTGFLFASVPPFGQELVVAGHTAVQVQMPGWRDGELVIDWTARQYDPSVPVPLIVTAAAWRAFWRDPATPADSRDARPCGCAVSGSSRLPARITTASHPPDRQARQKGTQPSPAAGPGDGRAPMKPPAWPGWPPAAQTPPGGTSMTATDPTVAATATAAGIRQPVVVRTKGELVRHLIGMDISCFDAYDLADLTEGDQYAIDLGNHACGGRAPDGPHHDLWIIAVTGGWWLLLPVPGGASCQAVACDGTYAPRPRSAGRVPGKAPRAEPGEDGNR